MLRKNKLVMTWGLALLLILSVVSVSLAQPPDIQGHWAQKQINEWISKGLAHGYQDGTFKPDHSITRAEFMTLVNKSFSFTTTTAVNFSDVSDGDWFAGEVGRARAAGYISGYQDGTLRPNAAISRQEAAAMLARITKLEMAIDAEAINKFKDVGDIPQWSKPAISAVVNKNFMHGCPDQTFQPNRPITRAEAIVTLNNAISASAPTTGTPADKPTASGPAIYDRAGTYGPATDKETINGDVIISADGVTLQNVNISGNLELSAGIGDGEVILKKVNVQGNTTIKGGGSRSVLLQDCKLPGLAVNKEGVRVIAAGSTTVDIVRLETGANLEEKSVTAAGFENITATEVMPVNATVSLHGDFRLIKINAEKIKVEVVNGTITQMDITAGAAQTTLYVATGAMVTTLNLDAAAAITGSGKIETARVNVSGSSFEQTPVQIEKASGVTVTIGEGAGINQGTKPGSGNNPLSFVSSDPADGSTGVSINPYIRLNFDRGVVRDYWDNNKNCIKMETNSGSQVSIHVTRIPDNDNEKRTIYVSPGSDLKYATTYRIIISAGLKANNSKTLGTEKVITFTTMIKPGGGTGGDNQVPAAPALVSSATNTQGGKIKVKFNKAMADPTGKQAEFIVKVNDQDNALTAAALDSQDNTVITLSLATPVINGDQITVAYTKGTVAAADGGVLDTFSPSNVANNVIPPGPRAPVLASATIRADGAVITLAFNKAMANPAGKQEEFSVLVDGTPNAVAAANLNADTTKIDLTLTTPIVNGNKAMVAYTRGTVTAQDGGVLETFASQNATNQVPGSGAPAPVVISTEVTTKGDISILFDKIMAGHSSAELPPANMAQIAAQFKVKVDNNNDVVTDVQLTNTPGKIKLVLAAKIGPGQAVTLAYTAADNETVRVKSEDGGILETFAAVSVANKL